MPKNTRGRHATTRPGTTNPSPTSTSLSGHGQPQGSTSTTINQTLNTGLQDHPGSKGNLVDRQRDSEEAHISAMMDQVLNSVSRCRVKTPRLHHHHQGHLPPLHRPYICPLILPSVPQVRFVTCVLYTVVSCIAYKKKRKLIINK